MTMAMRSRARRAQPTLGHPDAIGQSEQRRLDLCLPVRRGQLPASKSVNGVLTTYPLDGDQVVTDTINGTANQTLDGPGTDHALARSGEFFLPNHLNSTTGLTNGSGALTQSYLYGPFGESLNTPTDSNPFQYTGRENDADGLLYYRARYYCPSWGRFVSADPLGFAAGINAYVYAGDNPVNLGDASGMSCEHVGWDWEDCDDMGGGGGGGGGGGVPGGGTASAGGYAAMRGAGGGGPGFFRGLIDWFRNFFRGGGGAPPAPPAAPQPPTPPAPPPPPTPPGPPSNPPRTPVPGTPNGVITPGGTLIPLPGGYTGTVADNGQGLVYRPVGQLTGNERAFRIMEPTPLYPEGYLRLYNELGQPIDPAGRPGDRASTHWDIGAMGGHWW